MSSSAIDRRVVRPVARTTRRIGVAASTPELTPPADAPDDVLLSGLGVGDPTLALAFVRRFQRVVFGVALGILGDTGLAEDVAQQAFEQAWRHAEAYDPRRGSVRTWLISITHNLAVDTARVRRPIPVDPEDMHSLVAAMTDTPERRAVCDETSAELRAALVSLPSAQARALVLAAVQGLTTREIAEAEDIPLGTAKARIRAALTKLHAALPAQGGDHV